MNKKPNSNSSARTKANSRKKDDVASVNQTIAKPPVICSVCGNELDDKKESYNCLRDWAIAHSG